VLYPPELQGQELPKALPTKSLQRHPTTDQTVKFGMIWLIVSKLSRWSHFLGRQVVSRKIPIQT